MIGGGSVFWSVVEFMGVVIVVCGCLFVFLVGMVVMGSLMLRVFVLLLVVVSEVWESRGMREGVVVVCDGEKDVEIWLG